MPYSLVPLGRPNASTYLVYEKIFSYELCDEIISLAKQIPPEKALAAGSGHQEKRSSDIRWIPWSAEVDPIYIKMADLILHANENFWRFHLSSIYEPLQLTHYTAEQKGKYDWHADYSDKGLNQNRKISVTILLNEGFGGGEFELFDTQDLPVLMKGDAIVFPSYHVHRVTPITEGERWSLVSWISGPPYV